MGALPDQVMREGFSVLAATGGPVMGILLVIGLVIGILQAATQINDPALSFLPRLAALLVVAWTLGGWLLERYARFLTSALNQFTSGGG